MPTCSSGSATPVSSRASPAVRSSASRSKPGLAVFAVIKSVTVGGREHS